MKMAYEMAYDEAASDDAASDDTASGLLVLQEHYSYFRSVLTSGALFQLQKRLNFRSDFPL